MVRSAHSSVARLSELTRGPSKRTQIYGTVQIDASSRPHDYLCGAAAVTGCRHGGCVDFVDMTRRPDGDLAIPSVLPIPVHPTRLGISDDVCRLGACVDAANDQSRHRPVISFLVAFHIAGTFLCHHTALSIGRNGCRSLVAPPERGRVARGFIHCIWGGLQQEHRSFGPVCPGTGIDAAFTARFTGC